MQQTFNAFQGLLLTRFTFFLKPAQDIFVGSVYCNEFGRGFPVRKEVHGTGDHPDLCPEAQGLVCGSERERGFLYTNQALGMIIERAALQNLSSCLLSHQQLIAVEAAAPRFLRQCKTLGALLILGKTANAALRRGESGAHSTTELFMHRAVDVLTPQ
jgi:hypothetical protein